MLNKITTNQREPNLAKSYAENLKVLPKFRKVMPLFVKP